MSSKSVSNADAQVTGTFNLTFSASALPCQTLSIYGTNGTAVWDDHVVTVYTKDGKQAEPFKENAAAREDITNEFKDFHLAASFSAPAKLSLKIEDTFHHFAIIVAALRSAQSKKVETVPLPDE
jgi:predicted dehydrogenase